MAGGLVVRMTDARHEMFAEERLHESFSEPVPDFDFSRNKPLIAFITNESGAITHIARARKGNFAGTGLRRLHLVQPLELSVPIALSAITGRLDNRVGRWVRLAFDGGGLLSPKAFDEVVRAVSDLSPGARDALALFSRERRDRIQALSANTKVQLAEQKEAVLTALAVAGIDRTELEGWDSEKPVTSYLDGLSQARLREDPMIINDLMRFLASRR